MCNVVAFCCLDHVEHMTLAGNETQEVVVVTVLNTMGLVPPRAGWQKLN